MRYSLRLLLIAIALFGALCAPFALLVGQARQDAKIAKIFEAAAAIDVKELTGEPPVGSSLVQQAPRSQFWEAIYRIAGSPGPIDYLEIVGDRSAQIVAAHPRAFRCVRYVSLGSLVGGEYAVLTPEQVRAASVMPALGRMEIYARFDDSAEISELKRIPRIGKLEVNAKTVPDFALRQLSGVNAGLIEISCRDRENQLPSEGFAAFGAAHFTDVLIHGGIDDRAFELISAAPDLEYLSIDNTGRGGGHITDEGIRRASTLLHASYLKIGPARRITDDSIEAFAAMQRLTNLELNSCAITADGKRRLKSLRPSLTVDIR